MYKSTIYSYTWMQTWFIYIHAFKYSQCLALSESMLGQSLVISYLHCMWNFEMSKMRSMEYLVSFCIYYFIYKFVNIFFWCKSDPLGKESTRTNLQFIIIITNCVKVVIFQWKKKLNFRFIHRLSSKLFIQSKNIQKFWNK